MMVGERRRANHSPWDSTDPEAYLLVQDRVHGCCSCSMSVFDVSVLRGYVVFNMCRLCLQGWIFTMLDLMPVQSEKAVK